ncbi:MAG: hypothetical protein IJS46_02390, partial [Kiritimatiellae bacterium]|nr:hypothetical protein [Kiritimatiellia bacterium]
RAAVIAPAEVPVIHYASIGGGAGDVRPDLFYLQMRDLAAGGFHPVEPRALARRVRWGVGLPPLPVLIYIERVRPEAAVAVSEALAEYGFAAVVGGEIAARAGIGLKEETGIARIGARRGADALGALPRIDATPGDMSFSVRVVRDSKDPAFFGSLLAAQPTGARMPLSVIAYRPFDEAPFVQADAAALPCGDGGEALRLPLGADVEFPLEVLIYDTTRTLLYHSSKIPKAAVEKPAGWREPVSSPDREIELGDF